MEIVSIEQISAGQAKPYADSIYSWRIRLSNAQHEEIVEFCRKYLRFAQREEKEYLADYRDETHDFNTHMSVIAGGYYTLSKESYGTWIYTARFQYFD